MLNTVVVYHAKSAANICFDGFLAATIMWRKYGDAAEYIRALYHKSISLDKFVDKDVIFVDFSFDLEVMDEIHKVAKSLLVLDHHKSKSEGLRARSYAIHSKTACGSVLAWKQVYGDSPMPTMLEIIDDGDRALNVTPDVGPFHAALSAEPVSFSHWWGLLSKLRRGTPAYAEFIERGKLFEIYDKARVDVLVSDSFHITLCGINGLAVNANKFYAHLVGIKLSEYSKTFGAVFYLRTDGNVEVSLRRTDPDIDVEQIATAFGGGGHAGAAGFSVSLDKFSELINPQKCDDDLVARLDAATKLFQFTPHADEADDDLPNIEKQFLQHLERELGVYMSQDVGFYITKSVCHPKLITRLLSSFALMIGLPRVVDHPTLIHRLFPYTKRRKLSFDEDSIRNILLSSKPASPQVNEFFIERLLDTVNVTYPMELVTSTYYIHVTVNVPNSPLTIKHTFEVSK